MLGNDLNKKTSWLPAPGAVDATGAAVAASMTTPVPAASVSPTAMAAAVADGNGICEASGRRERRRGSHNSKTDGNRRKQGTCFRHDRLLW